MPELPEVHTTATILNELVSGQRIVDAWTNYNSPFYIGKANIKDPAYFLKFKKAILKRNIQRVYRRGKNIIMSLDNGYAIVIHMKMTGHLLHGQYIFKLHTHKTKEWVPHEDGPLTDPFNRFVRLVFTLSDGNHIAFSDMRKFATVFFTSNEMLDTIFNSLGPDPLDTHVNWKTFKDRLCIKPSHKIKTVLMNQELIVGIGNIYSDEILWSSLIHPERTVDTITDSEFKLITQCAKKILSNGIQFGGDSMSDYRNPYGLPGEFQLHHNAYRRTGMKCKRSTCSGTIERKVISGRSAHFCPQCQK